MTDFDILPKNMESLIIPSGLSSVLFYKGSSYENSTYEYIFSNWFLSVDYFLVDRPHFEILIENFKNDNTDSEEQI